jgi:hypothetical protein
LPKEGVALVLRVELHGEQVVAPGNRSRRHIDDGA